MYTYLGRRSKTRTPKRVGGDGPALCVERVQLVAPKAPKGVHLLRADDRVRRQGRSNSANRAPHERSLGRSWRTASADFSWQRYVEVFLRLLAGNALESRCPHRAFSVRSRRSMLDFGHAIGQIRVDAASAESALRLVAHRCRIVIGGPPRSGRRSALARSDLGSTAPLSGRSRYRG